MTTGREIAGEKSTASTRKATNFKFELCKFLNPPHCNTFCTRDYLFLKNVKKCSKKYVLFLDIAHHYKT